MQVERPTPPGLLSIIQTSGEGLEEVSRDSWVVELEVEKGESMEYERLRLRDIVGRASMVSFNVGTKQDEMSGVFARLRIHDANKYTIPRDSATLARFENSQIILQPLLRQSCFFCIPEHNTLP